MLYTHNYALIYKCVIVDISQACVLFCTILIQNVQKTALSLIQSITPFIFRASVGSEDSSHGVRSPFVERVKAHSGEEKKTL